MTTSTKKRLGAPSPRAILKGETFNNDYPLISSKEPLNQTSYYI